jgi:hypothetical protein
VVEGEGDVIDVQLLLDYRSKLPTVLEFILQTDIIWMGCCICSAQQHVTESLCPQTRVHPCADRDDVVYRPCLPPAGTRCATRSTWSARLPVLHVMMW